MVPAKAQVALRAVGNFDKIDIGDVFPGLERIADQRLVERV